MPIIRFAIENPVKVAVGVILVVLFGLLALFRIPLQLAPNVDQPKVTVSTHWEGASVQEIEREIVERQEEKLKGVSNLRKMTSNSTPNQAEITLEFFVGVDKDDAVRDVSEAMRQVTGYPPDIDEPVIQAADAAIESPIAWLILRGRPDEDASTLYDHVHDHVKPMLERVDGVARVDVYGGREREVHIRVDARKLAARHLTFADLEDALRRQNQSVTAGTVAQGKRDYTYRMLGKYEQLDEIENTVVGYDTGGPIFIRDVATVEHTFKKQLSFVSSKGDYVLALPVRRETGANVMAVMRDLKKAIEEVNRTILQAQGRGLHLTQTYDETVYIESAVSLVKSNIVYGGILTIAVLLVFLRSGTATFVVAASIPISIIGTFLVITLLGRTLNVIMLAGLAFAVGMVVDNAIVVLDNIFRHRQMGASLFQAALKGASEVWGAVLASTLTTMAVFIPVVFVEEEAGQLFRDIAIAISAGVGLSLLVSVLVIPPLANKVLHIRESHRHETAHHGRVALWMSRLVNRINGSILARLGVVAGLTTASLVGARLLVPPSDYLPAGNRNLILGFLLTPPGYSLEEYRRMGQIIMEGTPDKPWGMRQFWEAQPGTPEAAKLPPVRMQLGARGEEFVEVTPPPIDNFFFVSFSGRCFMGAVSAVPEAVTPLIDVMRRAGGMIEGVIPIFWQTSLFSGGFGGSSVEIEVMGNDLAEVIKVCGALTERARPLFGHVESTPSNFDLARDEIRFQPDRVKAAQVGLDVSQAAFILQAVVDGAYVGGFRDRGDEIDMKLIVERDVATKEGIGQIPVYTPTGRIVPISSFVDIVPTTAPQEILHIEELPAVMLTVRPPKGQPLETVMTRLEQEVIAPARAAGQIPDSVITRLAGNADKLTETFNAVKWNLLLALLITYLLMAALFESFAYPFVIMFSVPPATVGGFAGLAAIHWATARDPLTPTQQFDVLTMLGFIILIGIVVNNAILLVHQSLNYMREQGLSPRQAISESVKTRVRPIFMTALTTCCGMAPLVILPGAGSELYRGLGAVILGGLLVSTVFTLVLVPAMFSLFMDARARVFGLLSRRPASTVETTASEPVIVSTVDVTTETPRHRERKTTETAARV